MFNGIAFPIERAVGYSRRGAVAVLCPEDYRLERLRILLGLAPGVVSVWAAASAQGVTDANQVVITGARVPADQEITRRVEGALDSNRYLDASRITVTTRNGVVHLEGLVGDTGDLLSAIRTSNRAAGGARVVNELDTYEPDGFGN